MQHNTCAVRPFVFELGVEEIPAKFVASAIGQLTELVPEALKTARLTFQDLRVFGTPRRLSILIGGLSEGQSDLSVDVRGPAVKSAYDSEGNPTRAAEGFARGQGLDVSALQKRTVEGGGEYVYAVRIEPGRKTEDVLPEVLNSIILKLSFPRPMRWGSEDIRFIRPIRWIVALFGSDIVDLEVAGIKSNRISRGHRFLGSSAFSIKSAEDYVGALTSEYVMVDHRERQNEIWRQVCLLASEYEGIIESDDDLLEEICYLVEWPTALVGQVPSDFMHLPKPVITTPMKDHQRYFPVIKRNGSLCSIFITVRNGDDTGIENVRKGNEKVLSARLADARFFFEDDLKLPLANRLDDLKRVVFHEKLGTVYDRTERIVSLAGIVADDMGLCKADRDSVAKAARLAKADLVTKMVYEFTELQGIMGEEYALRSGEAPEVAKAIAEHYMPRNAGDAMPESLPGTALAIADKLDAMTAFFAVGIQPSGSADPFGLRRQALGICNILISKSLRLRLSRLLTHAADLVVPFSRVPVDVSETVRSVKEFILQRFRHLLLERGMRYDAVDAVCALSPDDITDAVLRVEAVESARGDSSFAALLTARNRAANLTKSSEVSEISPEAFLVDVEHLLYASYVAIRKEAAENIDKGLYTEALAALSRLEQPMNSFFEGVMVMAEDENVRKNRLALLSSIAALVDSVADFSRIVEC